MKLMPDKQVKLIGLVSNVDDMVGAFVITERSAVPMTTGAIRRVSELGNSV